MLPDTSTPIDQTPGEMKREARTADDKLRAAALRAELLEPTLKRLDEARGLLLQLRGYIAGKKLELPIDIDQELTSWLHEDVMARKERQS